MLDLDSYARKYIELFHWRINIEYSFELHLEKIIVLDEVKFLLMKTILRQI